MNHVFKYFFFRTYKYYPSSTFSNIERSVKKTVPRWGLLGSVLLELLV